MKLGLVVKVSRTEGAEYLSREVGLSFLAAGWRSIIWQRFDCDVGVRVSPPVGCLQFPGQWWGGAGHTRVQSGTQQSVVPGVGRLRTLYRLASLLTTFR